MIDKMKAIKTVDDMKDVSFIRTWMSDGLPSVTVAINGVHVTFENVDNDAAVAFMNPQDNAAKASILQRLKLQLALVEGEGLDDEDEFEAEPEYEYSDDSYDGDWGGNY